MKKTDSLLDFNCLLRLKCVSNIKIHYVLSFERTAKTWKIALERSVLKPDDLNTIPFTLLVPDLKVTFMDHKRAVVHIARWPRHNPSPVPASGYRKA